MKDLKIIEQLQKGNYKVFKHLYSHYSLIEKYILQNSGNTADAKDNFQNTLLTFYENIQNPDFELNAKISTYLYSISKNNWLKKITRQKEIATATFEENQIENSSPTQASENLLNYLLEKLKTVGEPCKSLITLFHFDKLSWEVIAKKLNYATSHAARNQKYKCFLKIRKLIPTKVKNQLLNNGN